MRFILAVCAMLLLATPLYAASWENDFQQAQTAYKAGDTATAAALFAKAGDALHKKKDPRAGLVWGNAAVAYLKIEKFEEAADLYEHVVQIKQLPQKQMLQAYKNLVFCRAELGQRALQIMTIDRMLKAIPKLPPEELADVYARQGDAYRHLELYGPAAVSYDKAAHVLPAGASTEQRAKILSAAGLCLGQMGDYANASRRLGEAHKLAMSENVPETVANALSNLGVLHWEQGDYADAMKLLNDALLVEEKNNLRKNEGADFNNLGIVQKSVGRHQEAMLQVEKALLVARDIGDVRDEAIATVNKALLYRIAGQLKDARAEYSAALKLFEECGFQEGIGSTHLGIGKMAELEDRNYTLALEHYTRALAIFEQLALPRWQASAFLQLGGLYKRMAAPGRATRDLVFDDEPTVPEISASDALAKSHEYYVRALDLAERLMSKEMIWAAHQGLGFAEFKAGNLEAALEHYQKAIGIVSNMYLSLEAVEILGEYMADKEELYGEAQEVCVALYEKTKDRKYLDLQMQLSETLRNEIQKASTALLQMKFEDPGKQALYEQINMLGRAQAKARKAMPIAAVLPKNAGAEEKAQQQMADRAAKEQYNKITKLDGDYQKLMSEWKKKYPDHSYIFDAQSNVDIKSLQKYINNDEIVLFYTQLPNDLVVTAICSDEINVYHVDITKKDLDKIIKKDFLVNYIEKYGRINYTLAREEEEKYFSQAINVLSLFYNILIKPASKEMENKKKIYVIADGCLAQVPFTALIVNNDAKNPEFLVEKYDISNFRPSFIHNLTKSDHSKKSPKTLLAVGNPTNTHISTLKPLDGAEKEVNDVASYINNENIKDTRFRLEATDMWLHDMINSNKYDILYFATHGVPYSEVYYAFYLKYDSVVKMLKRKYGDNEGLERAEKEKKLVDKFLIGKSPYNGYLYLSKDENNEDSSGLLTIKKIIEMPENDIINTKYVFLSACNTGVTFSPKTLMQDAIENDLTEAAKMDSDRTKLGWIPGIEQVSFVDAFMRKGIDNVYGTLWFVNDTSSSYIMSHLMQSILVKENRDIVSAYSETLRNYIKSCKKGNELLGTDYVLPLQPYLWAGGAIFGK